MPEFTAWAARCCVMLEGGKSANDILWFLGEDVDHKPSERSPFPHGYKYDYVNRDALMNRITVKDGRFVEPGGTSWNVLWVPPSYRSYVSEEVKVKIREFSKAGGKVVYGRVGKEGIDFSKAVEGFKPDVVCGPDMKGRSLTDWRKNEQQIEWLHRKDDGRDWYFVSANGMNAYKGEVTFRMEGDVSVWDPVTGAVGANFKFCLGAALIAQLPFLAFPAKFGSIYSSILPAWCGNFMYGLAALLLAVGIFCFVKKK